MDRSLYILCICSDVGWLVPTSLFPCTRNATWTKHLQHYHMTQADLC